MRKLMTAVLLVHLSSEGEQSPGHPFDATQVRPSIDSFVVVTRVTNGQWRAVGGIVQTVARDSATLRVSTDANFMDTKQRIEMAMDAKTLAPIAHWETLWQRGRGTTQGEVMVRDGRARGAYILSPRIFDLALDTGIVDNDASTALFPSLPVDSMREFTFRTFASPGQVEVTRVQVAGIDTISVPAGRFVTRRLVVMARDTSQVFVTATSPRRVVLIRLRDGSYEMRLVNR